MLAEGAVASAPPPSKSLIVTSLLFGNRMRKAASTNALNQRTLLDECPFAHALEIIAPRWAAAIVYKVGNASAPLTFGQLHALLPGVSNKMLAQRLRGLAAAGVLSKRVTPSDPPVIDYALTARGESLMPVLAEMENWAANSAT